MVKKMLVDATHPEETRVVVVQGNRLEDFDFESAARKQLIGNIYLAKVTRIEPSLQAAFVDYGGNRHGFLAFNEIHPDYYQIPVADRQALLEADAAEEQRAEDADEDVDFASGADEGDDADDENDGGAVTVTGGADSGSDGPDESADDPDPDNGPGTRTVLMASADRDSISSGILHDPDADHAEGPAAHAGLEEGAAAIVPEAENIFHAGDDQPEQTDSPESADPDSTPQVLADSDVENTGPSPALRPASRRRRNAPREPRESREAEARQDGGGWEDRPGTKIESVGAEDALDEVSRPRARKRQYKIQEVVKKRQIMLVQILKDERGSKGAALTTYLSIPGRYCVLMPNTARGGGISRKITNAVDRKRLKAVAAELEVPEGMGLIIRTAGANRTKAEIKRDFDYLLRQWETIRELTLRSTAPCLINEEGSIVKRAVRDLYDKDIEIIQVEGEASYREAKDFMRMLMPSHAKRVQPYREAVPLFQHYQVEAQLDSMFDPTVRLKSGGYIVINPTEALVSIDVNSGKSTREANIEATALRTNMEAAEEVARQLRLRDLAGLIVIDFIDMENLRNNKAVERKIKECLATDRANIQIGRISPFGLLEMSRQRLRQGVVETTTRPCSNCHGTGLVRSVDSLALRVLRGIEEECQRRQHHVLDVHVPSDVAIYILNQKRQWLQQIEARAAASIFIIASNAIQSPNFEIKASDRLAIIPPPLVSVPPAMPEPVEEDEAEEVLEEAADGSVADTRPKIRDGERRRKRGRGRPDRDLKPASEGEAPATVSDEGIIQPAHPGEAEKKPEGDLSEDEVRRRKMRRRRRGRGRGRDREDTQQGITSEAGAEGASPYDSLEARPAGNVLIVPIIAGDGEVPQSAAQPDLEPEAISSGVMIAAEPEPAVHAPVVATSEPLVPEQQAPEPQIPEQHFIEAVPEPEAPPPLPEAPAGPKRGGWWQRQFGK